MQQVALFQRRENVACVTSRVAMNEQALIAIGDAQARMNVATSLAMADDWTAAEPTVATAHAME
jgi:hypothetical protein